MNPDTFHLIVPPFPTIASRVAATGEEWLLQELNYDVSSKLKGLKIVVGVVVTIIIIIKPSTS